MHTLNKVIRDTNHRILKFSFITKLNENMKLLNLLAIRILTDLTCTLSRLNSFNILYESNDKCNSFYNSLIIKRYRVIKLINYLNKLEDPTLLEIM